MQGCFSFTHQLCIDMNITGVFLEGGGGALTTGNFCAPPLGISKTFTLCMYSQNDAYYPPPPCKQKSLALIYDGLLCKLSCYVCLFMNIHICTMFWCADSSSAISFTLREDLPENGAPRLFFASGVPSDIQGEGMFDFTGDGVEAVATVVVYTVVSCIL